MYGEKMNDAARPSEFTPTGVKFICRDAPMLKLLLR